MFSPFERLVAGRYLRARKAEGFVSVIAIFSFLGIMLGVATLIIVMSVMNGFRAELMDKILGLNGHMNVYAQSGPVYAYNEITANIMAVPGVVFAAPIIESQALLSSNGVSSGVMVRGITADGFAKKPTLSKSIVQGSIKDFTGEKVAVGIEIAKRLNLTIGDSINLISPKGKVSPFGTIPRSRSYEIGLIFDVGMYEYNSGFVFMPLAAAQTFFDVPQGATAIEIITKNPSDIDSMRGKVELAAGPGLVVQDWSQLNGSFFTAVQVERNVMFLILTLIIIVASFNIISSMIMLVKDKGRDIAIMRTMGATRRNMLKIFILTGASIGFAGTTMGAILGIAFALNIQSIREWLEGLLRVNLFNSEIYFLSKLPAQIEWEEVTAIVCLAFVLSILATLYPAWRAARLDPVEALRYE